MNCETKTIVNYSITIVALNTTMHWLTLNPSKNTSVTLIHGEIKTKHTAPKATPLERLLIIVSTCKQCHIKCMDFRCNPSQVMSLQAIYIKTNMYINDTTKLFRLEYKKN